MPTDGLSLKEQEVSRSLEKLRQEPINADGSHDTILTPIYTYLMAVSPGEDRVLHWFCSRAKSVVIEAATFLLRLHAYSNNPKVESWKERLIKVLYGCSACVHSYTELKATCRNTYLSAFSKSVLDGFFAAIDRWEANIAMDAFISTGVVSGSRKSASDAPPAVLYHILVSVHLLNEVKILKLLQEHPPCIQASGWPTQIPPGLLLLLFHETSEIRTWSQQQLSGCHPLKLDQFTDTHVYVLQSVLTALTSGPYALNVDSVSSSANFPMVNYFTMTASQLWSGLQVFLLWIPDDVLISRRHLFEMFKRTVVAHLHDKADHFPDVLRAFAFLLVKYGKSVWDEEKDDYPQVVFDAIKDNATFLSLIKAIPAPCSQAPWALKWFHPYLISLDCLPSFEQAFKKVMGFACEELQHERFRERRPAVMACVLQVINSIFRTQKREGRQIISQVFDIYAHVIIEIAVSSKKSDSVWHQAREPAHRLLSQIISDNFTNMERTLFRLSKFIQEANTSTKAAPGIPDPITGHDSLWRNIYSMFVHDDEEVMVLLITSVGSTATFDILNTDAYSPPPFSSDLRQSVAPVISSINANLNNARSSFLTAATQFTNSSSNSSNVVRDLIRSEFVLKNVVSLLLSPVEDLQMASQILIGQAYDTDIRSECFRALLERHPEHSIHALTSTLESFVEMAQILPEACGFAKTLVRCMTDVIEVLTNGRDGLFSNSNFCSNAPRSRLLKFWQAMCRSITVIFRRTPTWSRVIDADAMVEWMRDALIFARDLLAQWRAFEKAVSDKGNTQTLGTLPRKSTSTGKQILTDMQPILTESIRWLRLTDLELLHQSATLIQSLLECFSGIGLQPSEDAVKKLEKFLENARRAPANQALQTRLSNTHLSQLASLLDSLSQDDDILLLEIPKGSKSAEAMPHDWSLTQKGFEDNSKKGEATLGKAALSSSILPVAQNLSLSPLPPKRTNVHEKRQDSLEVRTSAKPLKQMVPPKSQIQAVKVSESSSESEASDEEGAGGLAALSKLQKSPMVRKTMGRRGIKRMEPVFNGNNATLERLRKREEAQRASLRMKPDLKPLYRLILDWNYDHEGSEPPGSGKRMSYTTIPDSFPSGEKYQSIFEPLLGLECWNQLIKSKQEVIESVTARINSRQYIDDFLELEIFIAERTPDKWRLSEVDIVLLRNPAKDISILSKVQAFRWIGVEIQATLHCRTDANGVDPGLHVNTQWKLSKVFSLSTVSREFSALKGLPYYDFYPDIMNPRLSRVPDISPAQIQKAKNAYRVNEPQAIAILSAIKTEGFTLVQGPPGTGKTWTICGIVGAFISTRPRPATVIQAGRSTVPDKAPPPKILVCAPSNAAIDEVTKRLQDGVRTSEGELLSPKIVRVGAEDMMNVSVRDVSLDQLVENRLNGTVKDTASNSSSTMMSLRAEMDALKEAQVLKRHELSNTPEDVHGRTILEDELKALNNKRMALSQQYNRSKDQQKVESRRMDAARRKLRAEVLQEADVICSTLSGSGHEALENVDFDTIVIDEAAQAVELSSLIPLKYRIKRCIMVGDPQQLPPTVLSPLASKYRYNQSLFVRLQKSMPEAVHLLSIQYRMHPQISHLPSKLFYDERLLDGPNMVGKTTQPWHTSPFFGAYKFIDVPKGGERSAQNGHSLINIQECDMAVALYNSLRKTYSQVNFSFRVGVIAMYRAQLLELKKRFKSFFGSDILVNVDFNTVDGFQGQEKDIIILSCVRAGPGITSIGFLSDHRRLNVAITRARSSLFIIGHAATLSRSDDVWKIIVEEARRSGTYLEADASTFQASINKDRSSLEHVNLGSVVGSASPIGETNHTTTTMKSPPKSTSKHKKKEVVSELDQSLPPLISLSKPQPRSSSVSDKKVLATTADEPFRPPVPRPPPMIKKKRVKEVNMFIPKKDTNHKRPAPESEPPVQGSAKRRITNEYRQA